LRVTEETTETSERKIKEVTTTTTVNGMTIPLEFALAIVNGVYDEPSGLFADPRFSGRRVVLTAAISTGLIDRNSIVIDPRTGRPITLEQALRDGIIDPQTAKFIDPTNRKLLPYDEAIKFGLIKVPGSGLWLLDSGLSADTADARVVDPATENLITWEEACARGIVNVERRQYVDTRTNESMSLNDAVEADLIIFGYGTSG